MSGRRLAHVRTLTDAVPDVEGVIVAQKTRPGRLIGGRYRLVGKLGSGGFGRVWKAHDESLHIDVAVKEVWLPPAMPAAEQAERLQRAEREARNAARLRDHPNIVAVHDVVIDNDATWIVMQLVDGCSLEEPVQTHGPLGVSTTAKVATALLRALDAAHKAGIVHRDVKPANVMLAATGEVLLTDFGIAVHQADTTLTQTGAFIGSVEYISPERARGQDATAASDLYSLGVTLYQAVEGNSPFRRDTPTASLVAILFEQAPPPQRAGEPLASLITQLLDKDPDQRPTIAQALTRTDPPPLTPLASGHGGQQAPARTTRPATTPGLTAPKKPAMWWRKAGALVILAIIVTLGGVEAVASSADVPGGVVVAFIIPVVGITGLVVGNAIAHDPFFSASDGITGGLLAAAVVLCAIAGSAEVLQIWMSPAKATWTSLIIVLGLIVASRWLWVVPRSPSSDQPDSFRRIV